MIQAPAAAADSDLFALRGGRDTPCDDARAVAALGFPGSPAFWIPERLVESAWLGHIPFAFWLMSVHRPSTFVELGVHHGASYLAFCQAIERLGLDTAAYGVDTWQGDPQAGHYDEQVFVELNSYHAGRYTTFSRLLRSTFDEAAVRFGDKSIDLLHIDGYHTYEAVRHDFETWRPKLSERGIVLLHDINVRERDFGVWRLWDELSRAYPTFAFLHHHGLGVVCTGPAQAPSVRALTAATSSPSASGAVRECFARLGSAVQTGFDLPRVRVQLTAALAAERAAASAERERLSSELRQAEERAAASAERERLSSELRQAEERAAASAERERLASELRQAEEGAAASAELERLSSELRQAEEQHAQLRNELRNEQIARGAEAAAGQQAFAMLAKERRRHQKLKRSLSWRMTRPLRGAIKKLGRRLRGKRAKTAEHAEDVKVQRATKTGSGRLAYDQWVAAHDTLTDADREQIRAGLATLLHRPLISVVMPVYNTDEGHLRAAIDSVRAQLYPHWQLCIADDASTAGHVRAVLDEYRSDDRVKIQLRDTNGHISAASNTALALADGEFVALMDHDDLLPEHALYEVAVEINAHPDVDLIYSDEDHLDESGRRNNPYFKPDWDPDLLLTHNFVSHLGVYRRSILSRLGGFRLGFEGSQDYDLALRVSLATSADRIRHIPAVLYHWRQNRSHASFSADAGDRCVQSARRAIREHLDARGMAADIVPLPAQPAWTRVVHRLPERLPLVSVIIPTRDRAELLATCLDGLRHRTHYEALEIIVVDNESSEPATLALLRSSAEDPRVRILRMPGPFNFSAFNNDAVAAANGEIVVLLNNDVDVIQPGWLKEMVSHAVRPDVGAVGAKLIHANGTVQHAGVVLGVGGVANHYGYRAPRDAIGYFGLYSTVRSVSAVTGACLAIRREVYIEVGGLNATDLKVAFNDVDFCLRVRQHGYRNVFTPFAELYHLESASRGSDLDPDKIERFRHECNYMMCEWGLSLARDPYYNVNFSLADGCFGLTSPPRRAKPWREHAQVLSA